MREDVVEKRKFGFALGIAVMALLPCSYLLAQSADLMLSNPGEYGKKRRAAVEFPHGLHMEGDISCTDCHHDYKGGKNALDESTLSQDRRAEIKCSSCHGQKSNNKYDLKDAFHLKCMGCHRKTAKTGKKTGPQLCAKCHPRGK